VAKLRTRSIRNESESVAVLYGGAGGLPPSRQKSAVFLPCQIRGHHHGSCLWEGVETWVCGDLNRQKRCVCGCQTNTTPTSKPQRGACVVVLSRAHLRFERESSPTTTTRSSLCKPSQPHTRHARTHTPTPTKWMLCRVREKMQTLDRSNRWIDWIGL
jgi:hypothetical protein